MFSSVEQAHRVDSEMLYCIDHHASFRATVTPDGMVLWEECFPHSSIPGSRYQVSQVGRTIHIEEATRIPYWNPTC